MMAFRPEAQTLLTPVQTTDCGRPAPIAHCRAGACPRLDIQCQILLLVLAGAYKKNIDLLGRQHVAEENLLYIFRLDLGDSLNGSYKEIV